MLSKLQTSIQLRLSKHEIVEVSATKIANRSRSNIPIPFIFRIYSTPCLKLFSYLSVSHFLFFFFFAGEHPAAMQRGCASNLVFSNLFYICTVLLLVQYINVVCTVAQSGRTIAATIGYDNHHVNDDDNVRTVVGSISTAALAAANSAAIAAVSSLTSTTTVEIDLTKHILNSR